MSLADYIFLVIFIIAFIMLLIMIIWRITCFFKKSCTWKNCPYRQHYHYTMHLGWLEKGCEKFPPTQEEIDEDNKMLDRLDELIDHLKEENKSSKP